MLKIKQTKKCKKIIAIIFILITLLSTMQSAIFAVSSSGTGQWVSGQWDTQIFTTENDTSVGMLLRRLINYTTGERLTVFCVEHRSRLTNWNY